jgi:hypothetical protein
MEDVDGLQENNISRIEIRTFEKYKIKIVC